MKSLSKTNHFQLALPCKSLALIQPMISGRSNFLTD